MKRVVMLLAVGAVLVAAAAPGWAQTAGTARLSWGTCDPQTQNAYLPGTVGSRIFDLILSVTGVTDANSGTDFTLFVGPTPIPDAWGFYDGGCQTSSLVSFNSAGTKTCPPS